MNRIDIFRGHYAVARKYAKPMPALRIAWELTWADQRHQLNGFRLMRVQPQDVFFLNVDATLAQAQRLEIQRVWMSVMGPQKLLILEKGMTLGVIAKGEQDGLEQAGNTNELRVAAKEADGKRSGEVPAPGSEAPGWEIP